MKLLFYVRRVSRLGQSSDRKLDRRGVGHRAQPGRPYTHLFHLDPVHRSQRLTHAANAGSAMHSINLQSKLSHYRLLFFFDDTPRENGALASHAPEHARELGWRRPTY